MDIGSIVECVKGYPGIIEEGQYYTIRDIQKGVMLYEVEPPHPYTSFLKERFKEVQEPLALEEFMMELLCDCEIDN